MTRCNTLLCGNEAVWQLETSYPDNMGSPTVVYKCDRCKDKGMNAAIPGWTRIVPPATLMASRVRSYYNLNV